MAIINNRILISIVLSGSVNTFSDAISSEDFIRVSQLHSWQAQLYLKSTGDEDRLEKRIHDDNFYFTKLPSINLVEELQATYSAMSSNPEGVDDQHPICQFPSRFLFLQENLALGKQIDILKDCPSFGKWAKFEQNTRLQVVKVDGYYGNPASSFGHLIIRLRNKESNTSLFDTSINYGASVPPGESTPVYIYKGLTGGYQASLANDDFYKQDLVYTQTEFRDMWNYELVLTRQQRLQFVAHIWEMLGRSSTYYFLKNNCAFAVAEMLEFILGVNLVDDATFWYPPVRLFHDLDALDKASGNQLILYREYVPSQKKMLARIFALLEADEKDLALEYISADEPSSEGYLKELINSNQTRIIETLIEYYDYATEGYSDLDSEFYQRRKSLLIARLALPMGKEISIAPIIPSGRPPGMTARTSRLEIGALVTKTDGSALIGFTPYAMAPLDRGNADLSELTMIKTQLAVSKSISFRDFTLLRVSQRSNVNNSIPNDFPVSWTLDLGANCFFNCEMDQGARALVGMGQTIVLGNVYASALLNLSLDGRVLGAGGELEFAVPERYGYSAILSAKRSLLRSDGTYPNSLGGQVRYSFSPKYSMRLSVDSIFEEDETNINAGVSLTWHFL